VKMQLEKYLYLYKKVCQLGFEEEIKWAVSLKPCENAYLFAREATWVIISSGMKNQVARKIEERIYHAISQGQTISSAFGHKGKVRAIEYIRENKERLFGEYQEADDKIEYLKSLPWIGDITKYHLAKNLGLEVVKPDRHLVRIAKTFGKVPLKLCKDLAEKSGDSLAVVDTVIWRAANLGLI